MISSEDMTSPAGEVAGLAPLLQVSKLSKQFPGVVALDQVDFDQRSGEVHILFGENGAARTATEMGLDLLGDVP